MRAIHKYFLGLFVFEKVFEDLKVALGLSEFFNLD